MRKQPPKRPPKNVSILSDRIFSPKRGQVIEPQIEDKQQPGPHVPLRSPDTRGLKNE
ncbi:hypothetical protein [Ruegeria sp. HKCCD7221]|uniref:hypothetical protein n=1 Tax=Ruegeria sp. HKCCD7221 TaxID=2683009 RepID=UPI001487AF81|nr:hypothetical protein [Ruegeria sp. HKCCD7221]